MSLANPWWLLLLPPVFALIFVLHARRRRDLAVAGFRIWQRVAASTSNAPERRRFPWRDPRLWLQLLAAAFAILALAQPSFGRPGTPQHWLVLIDASVGMTAVDVAPSRFAAAQAYVRERWGDDRRGDDLVSLLRVGAEPTFAAYAWRPGAALAERADQLAVSHGRADWLAAAARVAALVEEPAALRLVVLSDASGGAEAQRAFAAMGLPMEVETISIGQAFVNVAVEGVTASPRGEREDQWMVSGRIATQGLGLADVVRVVMAYRPFGSDTFLPWGGTEVLLDAQGVASFEVPLDLPGPGEIAVRGPRGDHLPADDEVIVVLRRDPVRVAFVGPVEPSVARALAAVGGVELFVTDTMPTEADGAAFDLVVVTADAGGGVPVTSTLWFGAVPGHLVDGPATGDRGTLSASAHPLMRDIDATAIEVTSARPLQLPAGATPLLLDGDAVLAWARTTDRGRQVAIGFDAAASTWPAQLSFPAFFAALVEWSAPRAWSVEAGGCQAGSTCPWPREAFLGRWHLRLPDGTWGLVAPGPRAVEGDVLAAAVWDEAVFDAGFRPESAGRHVLAFDDGTVSLPVVAASVSADPAPSPLDPAPAVDAEPAPRPLGRWLALIAALAALADLALSRRPLPSARPASRPRWPLVLPLVAIGSWLLAAIDAPLPLPGAGGVAIVVTGSPAGEFLGRAPTWSQERIRVLPGAEQAALRDRTALYAEDLATALDMALAWPSQGRDTRIILAQDELRRLTAAEALGLAARAEAAGIAMDVWQAPVSGVEGAATTAPAGQPGLAGVRLPEDPRAGARFLVQVTVQAAEGVPWRVAMEPTGGGDVATAEGSGSATVSVDLLAPEEPGEVQYHLHVAFVGDEVPASQTLVSVAIGDRPSVLLVSTDGRQGTILAQALQAQSIDVRRVTPRSMPPTLEGWRPYDAIVLVDVPASQIFTAYQELLEVYVRDLGGGLLIFGGPSSFGPGGYFLTPLEDLSPLSAQIEEEAPEVAMAFVLDRSGSMNAAVGSTTRMDVAKVATLEALGLLGPDSLAAIVVFDTEAQVVLPMRSVRDVAAFEEALASVDAAGGTSIHPALVLVHDLIRSTDSASRHVVVMTDGLSQLGDFASALGALRELGVTTSFVGIGDGADRTQLTALANLGGGALHMATDVRALPSILAQEALMLSVDPVEEGLFRSDWLIGVDDPFLQGIGAAPPPDLLGYVRTTAKDEATVHLVELEKGDPLLASWRYGLGRVAAFASEADGPWAVAWTEADAYARTWSQVLRWVAAPTVRRAWSLELAAGGPGALDVVLVAPSDAEGLTGQGALAQLMAEDGRVVARRVLQALGPDRSGARFDLPAGTTGSYTVRVDALPQGGLDTTLERSLLLPLAPLPPLRADAVDPGWLAMTTGGELSDRGVVAFPSAGLRWWWSAVPMLWMAGGLLVFLLVLLVRYGVWGAWLRGLRRLRQREGEQRGRPLQGHG